MKLNTKNELDIFCKKYNYIGSYEYNQAQQEHQIIISREDNNAGAFLTQEEIDALTVHDLHALLELLHYGFQEKFQC